MKYYSEGGDVIFIKYSETDIHSIDYEFNSNAHCSDEFYELEEDGCLFPIAISKLKKYKDGQYVIKDEYGDELNTITVSNGMMSLNGREYDARLINSIMDLSWGDSCTIHYVKHTDDKIGIEIECFVDDSYELDRSLNGFAEVGEDGSLSSDNGDDDVEVRLLTHSSCYQKDVSKLCDELKKENAYVNSTCGLHIHIDMTNRDAKECYNRLVQNLDLLYTIGGNHRRNNRYCAPNITTSGTKIPYNMASKYYAINYAAMQEHGTIEVRCHEGTVDKSRIISFIGILLKIVKNEKLTIRDLTDKYEETIDKQIKDLENKKLETRKQFKKLLAA